MAMPFCLTVATALLATTTINAQEPYQTKAVNRHNEYRVKHHSPNLVLDNDLNNRAVQCATYYAGIKAIDHNCPYKNGAGENLVGGNGVWSGDNFATSGTDMWYNEVNDYDYNNPGFSYKTGHFTQVVWKASQKFGFAVVTLDGYTAGVGLYSPPGNYQGQFPANVLRP